MSVFYRFADFPVRLYLFTPISITEKSFLVNRNPKIYEIEKKTKVD